MWHSLDERGNIEVYDVQWPNGKVETNIPVAMLESVREGSHEEGQKHGVQERYIPINERIYKGKMMKITRNQLRIIIEQHSERTSMIKAEFQEGDECDESDLEEAQATSVVRGVAQDGSNAASGTGEIEIESSGMVTANESKMRITRRQLRRIIKEASWGETAEVSEDGSFFRDVIVMSPNGDSVLVDGQETYIEDVPRQIEAISGIPMEGNDPDNLIFALEEMWRDGYVELAVTYENGHWGW